MKRLILVAAFMAPLLLISVEANAQTLTSWAKPLEANADSLDGQLPPINQPQPGWSPKSDIKSSDGTATVPACSDPTVIATVRDGILEASNQQLASGPFIGQTIVHTADMSTIWVHPTYSNSTVCDTQVQLDVPDTNPDEWEFEAFAENGQVQVYYYDKTVDNQGNQ